MAKHKETINVLSIDGGGIRGVIPAEILTHIEYKLQKMTNSDIKIAEHFDLIVGTSTGAILTGMYSIPDYVNRAKYSAQSILDNYMQHGSEIFYRPFVRKIKTVFGLFGTKYNSKKMMDYYKNFYGETLFKDAVTNIMLTSVDTNGRNLFLFKSYDDNKNMYKIYDGVRASSAAPSYFTPHKLMYKRNELSLTDGGLAINNPSITAYIESKKLFPHATKINMLSLGTGKFEPSYKYNDVRKWGKVKWLMPLIKIILSSTSEAIEYQTDLLYQTNYMGEYLRIDPTLKYGDSTMDNVTLTNLNNLKKDGHKVVIDLNSEIDDFLSKIIQ